MGLTGLHGSYGSWHLYICCFQSLYRAFAFEGQNMMFTVNAYILTPGPVIIRTVCKYRYHRFLSRVSYLSSYVFLRKHRGKLYFEKAIRLSREILMFLAAIWSSVCFWSSMYSLLTVLRVAYAIVRLSLGKPPGIIFVFISKAKCPLGNIWVII